ncbi:MAG: adenylate/guanylate cyclase domain-containing protein [Gammaproteobacteria bacterium]|nr:adenylate/guanylate cyclase domain-containing protein [Gammaproteobacteria bacterium]
MRVLSYNRVNRLQSVLIFAVFVVFAINALGVVDFAALLRGGSAFNGRPLGDLVHGSPAPSLTRIDVLAFVVVGLALALALPKLPPIGASLLTLCAMVPPFYCAWFFPVPPPLIPLEYTLLTVLVLFAVNVLSSYFIETHEKQKLISAFGQYVPPALVGEISRRPEAFSMAGEARDLTVLFCDIKRFTALSEQLEARELADLLNHYLTAMTDVLHTHDATIDKYIGDAIMAFWGAPVAQPDHAAQAVRAALAMQDRMAGLREEFSARGWPPIEIGIGVARGVMSVGNMGSRYRVAYTVIGDAVNLAARLEGLTRLYGVDVLVSGATRTVGDGIVYRELDHVRVKGKAAPHRIYQPLPAAVVADETETLHEAALAAYYRGDWVQASDGFARLAAGRAGYYAMMLERMASHGAPPPEWDGIVNFGGELTYSLSPLPVAAAAD